MSEKKSRIKIADLPKNAKLDLSEGRPELVERLGEQLDRVRSESRALNATFSPGGDVELTDAMRAELRALGYLDASNDRD